MRTRTNIALLVLADLLDGLTGETPAASAETSIQELTDATPGADRSWAEDEDTRSWVRPPDIADLTSTRSSGA